MGKSVKLLVICAMCVALSTVTSMVKIFEFPTGGSITLLSMFFGALPGLFFGTLPGLITGIVYGVIQFALGPYVLHPVQVILDYGAFAALGLAAGLCSQLFKKSKWRLQIGYAAGCIGRYIFAFLAGWVFWGSYAWEGWPAAGYSAVYNIIYIGAEAVITLIIISIPAVARAISRAGKMASE